MLPVVLALIILAVVMVWSSRVMVGAFEVIVAHMSGKRKLIMASLFVALGTSLPELALAITSAVENQSSLSVGNLLGANVANVSLIVGVVAIVAGSLSVVGDFLHFEMAAAFVAGAAPLILLMDGELSRLDGVILLVVYLIYFRDLVLADRHKVVSKGLMKHTKFLYEIKKLDIEHNWKVYAKIVFGMAILLASSDLVVKMATGVATVLHINSMVVGIVVLAIGTTLPELILSITAIREKQVALVFGNLLGSVVTNSTLIMGILAVIRPVSVATAPNLAMTNISFVLLFGLLWLLTKTKKSLERWEGMVLVGCFLMATGLQFLAR